MLANLVFAAGLMSRPPEPQSPGRPRCFADPAERAVPPRSGSSNPTRAAFAPRATTRFTCHADTESVGGRYTGAGPLVAAMNKAVNYAASRGVLVVSAAGNDDVDHAQSWTFVPAESGSGIAVSSTGPVGFAYGETNFRRIASYTNYGHSVIHVAAPGGDFVYPTNEGCSLPRANGTPVTIPCWAFDMVLSTSRGSGASTTSYSWAAGTSMAAPAASAVAALIKQKYPTIPLGALKSRLAQSADDEGPRGHDPFYGRGFVNAARACSDSVTCG